MAVACVRRRDDAFMNAMAYKFPDVPPDTKRFLLNCVGRETLARDRGLPSVTVDGLRLFHLPDVREWCTGENLRRCYDTTPLSERIGRVK
jgi:hypothetical protein